MECGKKRVRKREHIPIDCSIIPNVTKTINFSATLSRKLREMLPDPGERKRFRSELWRYGVEKHEKEDARVRLAVLKVAGLSAQRIHEWVDIAKRDYRDVLSAAEYPNQLRAATWRMEAEERSALGHKDLEQYLAWTKKP